MFVFKTLNHFSFFYFCIVNYTENFPMQFLDFLFFFQCTHLWKDLKKTTTNMHICVPMHLNDEIASYTNVVESIVSCHADCLVLFIRLNGQWLFFFCEVISDLRVCSGWMHINERHPGYAKKWWIENVFARPFKKRLRSDKRLIKLNRSIRNHLSTTFFCSVSFKTSI